MPREHPLPHPKTESIEKLATRAKELIKEKGEVRDIKDHIAATVSQAQHHVRTVEQMTPYEKRFNAMKLAEFLNDIGLVAKNAQLEIPRALQEGLETIARRYELLRTEGSREAQTG